MSKLFLSILTLFLFSPLAVAAQKQVIANEDGETIVAASADSVIVVQAIAVISTSTTSTEVYFYNGDNSVIGSSDAKIVVDRGGIDGPMGFVLSYNEEGWNVTDAKNEALQLYMSNTEDVIVLITYKTVKKY